VLAIEYAPGTVYAMADCVTRRAADMLRGDAGVKGGIMPMMKIAHMAEGFRMKGEDRHGGDSPNHVANFK
jgi:L-alanine-DL-glutamate epimerase-like enolase superfamily enzyme